MMIFLCLRSFPANNSVVELNMRFQFKNYNEKLLSFFPAAGSIIMSIPPIMIGAIVRSTEWGEINFFETG